MAIKNLNGGTYSPAGTLQQFNPNSSEMDLFNLWDQAAIQQGGSPIEYYEVEIQTQTVDPLYWEDRGKLWCPNPIQLYAYYEPEAAQNFLTTFGIDSPNDVIFELNYRAVISAIGYPPKIGSRIFSPHRQENWVIQQRNLSEFKMWGVLHIQLLCQRFQESLTTGEGKVTQKQPDFEIQ